MFDFRAAIGITALSLAACQSETGGNSQEAERAGRINPEAKAGKAGLKGGIDAEIERYPGDMEYAFAAIFGTTRAATVKLPQSTDFGPTGKWASFSVAPLAFERTQDRNILITTAESPNPSHGAFPGGDNHYIGVYYFFPDSRLNDVEKSFPLALTFIGASLPNVTRRFTSDPVLVNSSGFLQNGVERHWDEVYALNGREPELIAIIPRACGHFDLSRDRQIEAKGRIKEIRSGRGFTVEYEGDVNGSASWDYRNGRFVMTSPYPKLCDWDYSESIKQAKP